jgi:hypothetical protein
MPILNNRSVLSLLSADDIAELGFRHSHRGMAIELQEMTR